MIRKIAKHTKTLMVNIFQVQLNQPAGELREQYSNSFVADGAIIPDHVGLVVQCLLHPGLYPGITSLHFNHQVWYVSQGWIRHARSVYQRNLGSWVEHVVMMRVVSVNPDLVFGGQVPGPIIGTDVVGDVVGIFVIPGLLPNAPDQEVQENHDHDQEVPIDDDGYLPNDDSSGSHTDEGCIEE